MIRILTSLVAVLTISSIQSQTTMRETPKLVIGITIDQLRGDYLELFQKSFTERGFKRLLNEGLVYQNMVFDFPNINQASSVATIYTGTTPFYHGITGNKIYASDQSREVSIFRDDNFLGNYTNEKLSPVALQVGTIGDELKIASKGKSDVFALAPSAYQALASVGRLANGAYWIDDYTGKWSSTTYYKDMYWAVEQDNRVNVFSNQGSSLVWNPLLSSDKYNSFAYAVPSTSFSYQFGQTNSPYLLLKESPYVNENITNTAIKLLEKDQMGSRTSPDFFAITYYAGDYSKETNGDYSYTVQDIYARLDREIEKLIDYVEKNVGLQNTFIFVTSTGYYDSNSKYPDNVNATPGTFFPKRCEALLNIYLMAIYGNGQWVERYYDSQIYLNRKLIESKKIDLEEIQNKAVEFVVQFTGVQDAVTATQLFSGTADSEKLIYRDMLNKKNPGDVILEIQPGFTISEENTTGKDTTSKIERQVAIVSPAIFFGANTKPERIKRTIKATEIAPTVSRVLRIRSPNAAKDEPLPEFL